MDVSMEHNEDSSKEEHTEPEQSPLLGTDEGNNGLAELIGIEEAQRISPDARKILTQRLFASFTSVRIPSINPCSSASLLSISLRL